MTATTEISRVCKLRPLYNKIIVRKLEKETRTEGGLYIPDNAQAKPVKGLVLAIGPGDWDDKGAFHEVKVEIGTTVVFDKYTGIDVRHDGEEYTIMPAEAALAEVADEY